MPTHVLEILTISHRNKKLTLLDYERPNEGCSCWVVRSYMHMHCVIVCTQGSGNDLWYKWHSVGKEKCRQAEIGGPQKKEQIIV